MNSFGRIFRLSIFGESHGVSVGVTVDGCPAGISLSNKDFETDLSRRKSGAKGTTSRKEADIPKILSGTFNGKTTGAPLTLIFENIDTHSSDYQKIKDIPRPGHADFVALKKFGSFNDYRAGGHFSGRLTLGLVAAGVIAKKNLGNINISASLIEAGGKKNIEHAIDEAQNNQDSIGGIIECKAENIPAGLGEPFFDSVESLIGHIIFSIPAIKGIEFGAGFAAAKMKGSEHNDLILDKNGKTASNNSGGINGGITNGNDLFFRVVVKPTSSIPKKQKTIHLKTGKLVDLKIEGRHDTCIALRVPVIVEAVTAIVLADLLLLNNPNRVF